MKRLLCLFFFLVSSGGAQAAVTMEDVVRYGQVLAFEDPKLLAAVAEVESSLDATVTTIDRGVRYYGLMQISLGTAQEFGFTGKAYELLHWKTNVRIASRYLSHLLSRYNNNKRYAVAAYNAGTVKACKTSKRCRRGQLVNEVYVKKVMYHYARIDKETLQ